MTSGDVALWVGVGGTLICAGYAALGYHRPKKVAAIDDVSTPSSANPPLRWPWIPVLCVVLTWTAVGFDYFTRVPLPEAAITNYGLDGGNADADQYHGIVQFRDWTKHKDEKGMLITHTLFGDVDKMTDTFIAKSGAYTITGPALGLVLFNKHTMRYVPNQTNMIEFDFVVLPTGIAPEQIRTLSDVSTLGGKLLAVAAQGIPVIVNPTSPPVAQTK